MSPQRGLIGPIISRFENRGFKLAAIKLMSPSKEHLEKHYEDLSSKSFFPGLIACTLYPPYAHPKHKADSEQTWAPAPSAPWSGKAATP